MLNWPCSACRRQNAQYWQCVEAPITYPPVPQTVELLEPYEQCGEAPYLLLRHQNPVTLRLFAMLVHHCIYQHKIRVCRRKLFIHFWCCWVSQSQHDHIDMSLSRNNRM